MDFDFPIEDVQNNPSQVAMHNLLNAPANPVPWGASDLPALQEAESAKRRLPPSNTTKAAAPFALDDSPPIEPHIVCQMGGLPYADLCKERARERFKEMKKNEHMANGDFDRMKRRKKGDTSMTPNQKYRRRLRMNQDSAAAARFAQEVYVHVLEKLVKTTEVEKKALLVELAQLRQENASLNSRVSHLEGPDYGTQEPDNFFDPSRGRYNDGVEVAKLVDMLTAPETVSAQATDPSFTARLTSGGGVRPPHAA